MKKLALAFLLLASINPASAATFTLRLLTEPTTLDWNRAYTPIENYILYNVMEGLVTFDAKLKVQPTLAESWKISSDGRTYTFKLRKGVKWSDGVALRAQDFVFSWKRLLTAETAASYAYLLYDIVGAQDFYNKKITDFSQVGIRAVDDRTLEVKLAQPVANWIQIPTFWVTFPMREDLVIKYGASWTEPGKMVSVGPFVLASHEAESRIVLKTNPLYYGKRGNVEQVVGLIVRDDSTALTLFEAGKIDYLNDLSMLDIKRLQGRSELKTYPYLKTVYLGFNAVHPVTKDPAVRQALALAIDTAQIGKVVPTSQEAARSFVPRGMIGFFSDVGLKPNVAQARKALGGKKLPPLTLLTSNLDRATAISQFLQAQLKQNLGIEVAIESYDYKTFRSQLHLKQAPLFVMSWSADYPDPDNYMSILMGSSGNNRTGWSDATFDAGVLKARFSRNTSERLAIYKRLQKQVQEQAVALLPLYYEPNVVLVSKRTQGFNLNPINYLLLKDVRVVDQGSNR